MSSCIDSQPSEAKMSSVNADADCPKHLDVAHYVIVRADLPHGSQVAQTIHAAGESIFCGTNERQREWSAIEPVVPGTIAVALHARDESHLKSIAHDLAEACIDHHVVEECDGEWMSIGLRPTTDRAAVRKVLSQLPLVR